MQNMGKAWLRAEVRNLESKTERNAPLPPYLIVDCDALVNFSPLVKQFVNSKKFIVLVPSVGKLYIYSPHLVFIANLN